MADVPKDDMRKPDPAAPSSDTDAPKIDETPPSSPQKTSTVTTARDKEQKPNTSPTTTARSKDPQRDAEDKEPVSKRDVSGAKNDSDAKKKDDAYKTPEKHSGKPKPKPWTPTPKRPTAPPPSPPIESLESAFKLAHAHYISKVEQQPKPKNPERELLEEVLEAFLQERASTPLLKKVNFAKPIEGGDQGSRVDQGSLFDIVASDKQIVNTVVDFLGKSVLGKGRMQECGKQFYKTLHVADRSLPLAMTTASYRRKNRSIGGLDYQVRFPSVGGNFDKGICEEFHLRSVPPTILNSECLLEALFLPFDPKPYFEVVEANEIFIRCDSVQESDLVATTFDQLTLFGCKIRARNI